MDLFQPAILTNYYLIIAHYRIYYSFVERNIVLFSALKDELWKLFLVKIFQTKQKAIEFKYIQ